MPSFGKIPALILFSFLITINLFVLPAFAQQPSFTTPPVYEITPGIPSVPTSPRLTFFFLEFDLDYKGGKVLFSSKPDGTGDTRVDDAAMINVRKPNGVWKAFDHPYTTNCNPLVPMPPKDLSYLFEVGVNRVQARLYDICGVYKSSTPLYLVTENLTPSPSPSPSGPEPFLDLPWDYGANGMSFNEAASSITSFFDHEYPLLSAGLDLVEPTQALGTIIDFNGGLRNNIKPYSKHDGYDYAKKAKINFKDPVKAAASGKAYYKTYFPGTLSRCGACGEMIVIDHGNGYITRYLHLDDGSPLFVNKNDPGPKDVTTGTIIGYVGHTGNTSPEDERGAHIHFDVIHDKNSDGDFEDNIPDGITDPFGWQSTEPDPWENYSFNYAGNQRTGNKSYYLFTKKLDNLNANLTSNAAVFEVGKTKLEFPQGATNETLNISINSGPNFTGNLLNSLGSVISVEAKNQAGDIITTFLKNFSLTINFSQFDLSRFNLNTFSIYSSPDGQNWTKENTLLGSDTATSSLNHLTYFALMAERKDTIAPTTTPILEGEKGMDNNFRSDVKLNLQAEDNEGGLGVEFSAFSYGEEGWQTYTDPLSFSSEGLHKVNFYSQDNDGNIEGIETVEFSIDKTPPVINAIATVENSEYTPGTWVKKDVTVSFSCADDYSGVLSVTEPEVISNEGENQKAKGVCLDKAGNSSEVEFAGINIDKISPVINLEANPTFLWPPSNKMVDVFLTGEVLETNLKLNTLNIEDEYNLVEPEIKSLNQVIKLQASRNGEDLDGRVYTIKAYAEDLASNSFEKIIKIIVPHDEGS